MKKLPNSAANGNKPNRRWPPPKGVLSDLIQYLWDELDTIKEEIRALRLDTIEEEIKALRRQQAPDGPDALLTRQEAADVLNISVRKLDELAEAGRLRPVRIDRAVRYHPGTLERFVRNCAEGKRS
jgi:excisionase family DNA binding protein